MEVEQIKSMDFQLATETGTGNGTNTGLRLQSITFAVLCVTLVGCSTTAVPVDVAVAAPSERVMLYQKNGPDMGRLVLVRDSGMLGSGCFASLFVDGERAARLDTKEKVVFYLPAGEHLLGAALEGKGLCAANAGKRERDFVIKANQSKSFRVFTSQSGDLDILPTSDFDS
ncbi:hypothetical protein ACYZTL_03205 [Pseudomonas sp. LB3P81]